jgi:cytochrome b561
MLDSVPFLRFLIDLFVNTFGITPPTPETERHAGRVIAMMLAGVLVMLLVVAWILRAAFLR